MGELEPLDEEELENIPKNLCVGLLAGDTGPPRAAFITFICSGSASQPFTFVNSRVATS